MSISGTLRFQALAILLVAAASAAHAQDVIEVKRMTMEMARDIAQAAVEECRDRGYQVTAVVVDRAGIPQMMMRDVLAPRFTIEIAESKANAVVLGSVSSGEFRRNREDIRAEMNEVQGVLLLEGGLPIEAAGSLLGAVGVSGAPGGDKDAACAREGIKAVQDRLDFIQ